MRVALNLNELNIEQYAHELVVGDKPITRLIPTKPYKKKKNVCFVLA